MVEKTAVGAMRRVLVRRESEKRDEKNLMRLEVR